LPSPAAWQIAPAGMNRRCRSTPTIARRWSGAPLTARARAGNAQLGMPTPPQFVKGNADRGATNISKVNSPLLQRACRRQPCRHTSPSVSIVMAEPASRALRRRPALVARRRDRSNSRVHSPANEAARDVGY